jgi:hypothetical protein
MLNREHDGTLTDPGFGHADDVRICDFGRGSLTHYEM